MDTYGKGEWQVQRVVLWRRCRWAIIMERITPTCDALYLHYYRAGDAVNPQTQWRRQISSIDDVSFRVGLPKFVLAEIDQCIVQFELLRSR
jgi:hypothetical protein